MMTQTTSSTLARRAALAGTRPTRGRVGGGARARPRRMTTTASIRATEKPQGQGARALRRENRARDVGRCARALEGAMVSS